METTSALHVDPTNREQLAAWDGDEGAYWAEHADYFERSVTVYDQGMFAAAAIGPADRVLDVGCGTGQTTRDAARAAPQGSTLGIDLSSRMVERARRQADAESVSNVEFLQADAQIHPFAPASFDVAISRTGAMFFGDPAAAFTNIGTALVPGGRLVLVAWQPLPANEWIREIFGALAAGRDLPAPPPNSPGPFALADPDRVRDLLTGAGFADVALDSASAGMWFGADADDAAAFVLGLMGWLLVGLDDAGRARAISGLRDVMVAHETPDGVVLGSAAWTISAARSR